MSTTYNDRAVRFELVGSPTMCGPDDRLTVDGHDITRFISAVSVSAAAGELTSAKVTLCAPRLDIDVPASVTFEVVPPEGWVVLREPLLNGGDRYRCIPDEDYKPQRTGDEAI